MKVIVAAHPDDEVIGMGAQLPHLGEAVFVHITDGAPRDMMDARQHGFDSWEEYAAQRRNELLEALRVAGIPDNCSHHLGIADQEASINLSLITLKLYELLRELRPQYVITHPYEGGHPDHD